MTSFAEAGLGIIAALGTGSISTAASIINDISTGKEDENNAGQWAGGGSGSGIPMRPSTNRRHSPGGWTADNPQDIPMEGSYESMFIPDTPPGYPVETYHGHGRNIVPTEPTTNPSVPEQPLKQTHTNLSADPTSSTSRGGTHSGYRLKNIMSSSSARIKFKKETDDKINDTLINKIPSELIIICSIGLGLLILNQ